MAIWELAVLSVVGYLVVGFIVVFYVTVADIGGRSSKPEQFFHDMIREVRLYPVERVGTVLCWFLLFLALLFCFLVGGAKVILSGTKRERVT